MAAILFRPQWVNEIPRNIFQCIASVNSLGPSNVIWPQDIWVNIDSGYGLLPYGTKPLPEPM